VPEPNPDLQQDRWRFYFPWVKTAVGAPAYNDELLIANRTDRTWLLWHNFHSLGLLDAGDQRYVRVVRAGTISARELVAGPDTEYILASLAPDLVGLEVVDVSGGEGLFELRRIERTRAGSAGLPDSARIEDLNLSARTENALKRLGITTIGELKRADLGELWSVRNGLAAYAELASQLLFGGGLTWK
jgi:hypothetical protein